MSLIFKQLFERESCTYTYLIADSLTKEAAIIDAVDIMIERDTALLKELELDLKFIIETHIHADHITSACPLKKYYPNARIVLGMENIDAEACADIMVSEGHLLPIGTYEIKAIETPGHTIGCMSYIVEDKVLTGDALFIRSTGRCDFQGGSAETLYESIHKLYKLADNTEVYPAHDYNGLSVSTIGEEKKWNPNVGENIEKDKFILIEKGKNRPYPKKFDIAVPANMNCGKVLRK